MTVLFAIVLLGAVAGLFPSSLATSTTDSSSIPKCFCTSDKLCWPSVEDFAELQSQVSQRLVSAVPTADPYYPPDAGAVLQANWQVDSWPMITPINETDACYLDPTAPGGCGQYGPFIIGVDALSITDIQAAVQFAAKRRLKFSIRNTGHDLIGRNYARGSFVVWTHNMDSVTHHAEFTPEGAPAGETFESAFTLGAGVRWRTATTAANKYGRLIVSGGSSSVGSTGAWIQGGGHSALSPTYGLGVDNTLQMGVVLSSGEYLVANKYQNEDLFWALLGGGGGTYGVVTSVTYKSYPMVPVQKWTYEVHASDYATAVTLVDGYLRYHSTFSDAGWGGYSWPSADGITFSYWAPEMSDETAAASSQAWREYVASLVPSDKLVEFSETKSYSTWWETFKEFMDTGDAVVLGNGMVASRLLTPDAIKANGTAIADLLLQCGGGMNTVAGGKVREFAADSVGLTPAWRTAVVHPLCYGFGWGKDATPAQVESVVERVKSWRQKMHDLTPGAGAYMNEATPYEIDWQYTFFGDHYDKLKSIKDKYDSEKLFVVHQGVGSDEWEPTLTCRL